MGLILDTNVCDDADRADQLREVADDYTGIDDYPYTAHQDDEYVLAVSAGSHR